MCLSGHLGGWKGSLTESSELTASDGVALDEFGSSVTISKRANTVVVGAPLATSLQGKAYVFVRPAGGWSDNLTQTTELTASDGAAGDQFGLSVAIKGGTLAIGANQPTTGPGAAYVFRKE